MKRALGGSASARVRCAMGSLERRLLMASAEPVISELLAQNTAGITDEDGGSSDWIEIHNPGTTALELTGYYLSDSASNRTQWQFPAVMLAPDSFLIVWASNKNRRNSAAPLHTNFALSAGGEYLGLTKPDGATVVSQYSPSFPAQTANVSYGLLPDGSATFFTTPTPGAANQSAGVTAAPIFSHDRGFYDAAFSLELSSDTPGTTIRYTTDGSAPTTTNGTIFTSPISISTTTNIRAVAYKNGWTPSVVQTQTYLFLDHVVQQPASVPGFPNQVEAVGGPGGFSVPSDTAMDPNVVNDPAYSMVIKDALKSIPTLSITGNINDIFTSNGFYETDKEKGASIELLYPYNPANNEQINGAIEAHSHNRLKRAIRLSFKAEYGPTKWNTSLLKSSPLGASSAITELDDLVLRSGNNRSWARNSNPAYTAYTEDEWVRQTQIALSGYGSHGTFVHLYLNGVYWGLYNPVERPDEAFSAEYFGGDADAWYSTNHDGRTRGDSTRWDYLRNTLINRDLSISANYDELRQYLDVENLADYLILHWYAGVSDWPGNNWYAGNRNDVAGPVRYYAWDGEYSWDRGQDITVNGAWVHPAFRNTSTSNLDLPRIWRALRVNSDFMTMFADRVYQHAFNNGPLTDQNSLARWNALNDFVRDAVIAESARWGDALETLGQPTRTRDVDWQNEVNAIAALMNGNTSRFVSALRAQGYFPNLSPPIFSRRGGTSTSSMSVVLTNPNSAGTIYYTLDGSDPRLPGGGISPTAMVYAGNVALHHSANVTTRVLSGTSNWSAVDCASFTIDPLAALRVTEVMYHAAPQAGNPTDPDQFEFIELQNTGSAPLDLQGVQFTSGVDFTFGNVTVQPGEFIVLVENSAAFAARYGNISAVVGQYAGKLDNSGERIQLQTANGWTIVDFTYSDAWQPTTDGAGRSLVMKAPTAPLDLWNLANSWRASTAVNGSPGAADAAPNFAPLVSAGSDRIVLLPGVATLSGSVGDDGQPSGSSIGVTWSVVSGSGAVTFADSSSVTTTAGFSVAGTYVLRLTASDGALSSSSDVTIQVQQTVFRLMLVNADNDQDLFAIQEGQVIDLAALPSRNINVRAETSPSMVGSVGFGFDAVSGNFTDNFRTESGAPYAMWGNTGSDYLVGSFSVGAHRMTATPYTGSNLTGTPGAALTVRFTVIDSAIPPAPTGVIALAVSKSRIHLDWSSASPNLTGFKILHSIDGLNFSLLTTVGPGQTSYTDKGLNSGSFHYYRIVAISPFGDSPASGVTSGSTFAPGIPDWFDESADADYFISNGSGSKIITLRNGSLNFEVDGQAVGYPKPSLHVQNGQAIFQTSPHLDILTVDAGARVAVLAGHGVLLVEQLVIAEGGELDLRDNDLVVQAGDFASLRALVFAGFRRAQGITSSASDGSMILALFDNLLVGALEWTGQSLAPTAIIGKYTYFGDLNLDGQVTGDDYTIIDANLNTMPPQGIEWLRGDANLDGFVTGDDYTVVDANLGLGSGNALAPVARPESNWLSRRDENDELLY